MQDEPSPTKRRTLTIVSVAVVAVALAGAAWVATRPRGIDAVTSLLADEGAFDTTVDARSSFAKASDMLRAEGERCARDASAEAQPCAGELAAAAWAQVTAFRIDVCTQRVIAEARLALHRHLESLARTGEPPGLPAPPTC